MARALLLLVACLSAGAAAQAYRGALKLQSKGAEFDVRPTHYTKRGACSGVLDSELVGCQLRAVSVLVDHSAPVLVASGYVKVPSSNVGFVDVASAVVYITKNCEERVPVHINVSCYGPLGRRPRRSHDATHMELPTVEEVYSSAVISDL